MISMSNFNYSKPAPRKPEQPFRDGEANLGFALVDFWRWSTSDLLNNVTRGNLAEFIVAKALGITTEVRTVWAAYDLLMPSERGRELKIEVKSAAYLQGWEQDKYSLIQFDVRKTKALDEATSIYTGAAKRQADVYVFALLKHQNRPTIEPLNLAQWDFYVLPTAMLNREVGEGHSISLKSLEKLIAPLCFSNLRQAIGNAAPLSATGEAT